LILPTGLNLINTAYNLAKSVMDLIYPLRCGGCGANGHVLCKECVDTFLSVEEETSCPMCGMPVGIRSVCGKCLDEKNLFEEGLYGFYYENRLRDAIHSFKFSGRKDVGKHLVGLVEKRITAFSYRFDCIIPLPVTEKRLKERGFNQSFILAEEISRMTGKPVYHSVLIKTKETRDQYTLSRDERKKNIKGAFSLAKDAHLKSKKVLLVDDLYTTGQTAREAARTLLRGKAEDVVFFALARTL
jgi:competence protein ComFC